MAGPSRTDGAQAPDWQPGLTPVERLKHALVPGRLYAHYLAAKGWWRGEAELRLLRFLVDPARNSVDIGANKGVYTFFLARLSRQVFAFEPNPKISAILTAGVAANVQVFDYALSNEDGEAILRLPFRKGGYSNQLGSLSPRAWPHEVGEVSVPTRRLDGLGLADIGFIKIDVEGFERPVIEGASETLRRDRPVLLVELEEHRTGEPIEAAIAWIEDFGYRCLALHNGCLVDRDAFDPERQHRNPASPADYIFNFIFLPLTR